MPHQSVTTTTNNNTRSSTSVNNLNNINNNYNKNSFNNNMSGSPHVKSFFDSPVRGTTQIATTTKIPHFNNNGTYSIPMNHNQSAYSTSTTTTTNNNNNNNVKPLITFSTTGHASAPPPSIYRGTGSVIQSNVNASPQARINISNKASPAPAATTTPTLMLSSGTARTTTTTSAAATTVNSSPSAGPNVPTHAAGYATPPTNQAHTLSSPNMKTPSGKNYVYGPLFSWDEYLARIPAEKAPKEAFRQAPAAKANSFQLGMRLEARDPKKDDPNAWSLASVVQIEGTQRIRLRFDGCDSMSDIFELTNSENIKPLFLDDVLYPPVTYRGNIATYSTYFVKKTLNKPGVIVAPQECFGSLPPRPPKNLFKPGQKLEAIDRKNQSLIYPATIESVHGDEIRVSFDGWKGSFDYTCKYYSREIFPVGWCAETNHPLLSPKGYEALIQGLSTSLTPDKSSQTNTSISNQSNTNNSQVKAQISPAKRGRPSINNNNNSSVAKIQSKNNGFPPSSVKQAKQNSNKSISKPSASLSSSNSSATSSPNNTSSNANRSKSPTKLVYQPTKPNNPAMKLKFKHTPKRGSGKVGDESHKDEYVFAEFADDLSTSPIPPGVDKYQCQRTIPIEQQKRIKEVNNHHEELLAPTIEEKVRPNASIDKRATKPETNSSIDISNSRPIKNDTTIKKQQPIASNQNLSPSNCTDRDTNLKNNVNNQPDNTHQPPVKKAKTDQEQSQNLTRSSVPPATSDEICDFAEEINDGEANHVARSNHVNPIENWSVADVVEYLSTWPGLSKYSDVFEEHEINGQAFLLLTTDIMVRYMGIKIGPVLKVNELIRRAKSI